MSRRESFRLRVAAWVGAAALLVIAPNLIWIGTSTVRIHNASDRSMAGVAYSACEQIHDVGTLRAGESVFRFLEACGDDTLEILTGRQRHCRIYVEGELYHVDATIEDSDSVRCRYDDLLSSLLIWKVLR